MRQALLHNNLQVDKELRAKTPTPEPEPDEREPGVVSTPKMSRDVRDFGVGKSPTTWRLFGTIAKGFAAKEMENTLLEAKVAALEEQLDRINRTKKRRALPNPNKRFMTITEACAAGLPIPSRGEEAIEPVGDQVVDENEVESEADAEGDDKAELEPPAKVTRTGRLTRRPQRYFA